MSDSGRNDLNDRQRRADGDPFRTVAPHGTAENGRSEECPQHIGRYKIERLIGVGSFGRIYLAHDPQLQRLVAIKAPHSHLIARPEDAEPYLREARTLAKLDHPNIVPVYDVGSSDTIPFYIVSKYIEGTDLAARMQRERLNISQAGELVAAVADALHYAHTRGFVHRDIKPANILLERGEVPCVADFGLALSDENVGKGPRFAGTPAYMSPEQAQGEGHRVDGRSDIYSLGAVLYELLVGRRIFASDSQQEQLERTAHHDPKPPRQIDDTVPRELERICLKAVARRASERYTTAKDLAEDLRWFLAQHPTLVQSAAPAGAPVEPADSTHASGRQDTAKGDSSVLQVVPKGLRSFDADDADFFLELLPGPRNRDGLPDTIHFWKTRIEQTDADRTFSVGLIYGPSGCGKSSFLRAGLLPRLAGSVAAVAVESAADDTQDRLLARLRKQIPALPADSTLSDALAAIRTNPSLTHSRKLLIVLDQFEQWLHGTEDYENSSLAQALRQCDGSRIQCLLMVRDDFWMAVTRLMQVLEVRLVEGENSGTIDLFPPRHARKVLSAFGRALGDLPEQDQPLSSANEAFLTKAIDELAEDGHVICVRLALFAEMMKGKPWIPATLAERGGTEGAGVAFLEETFSSPSAPPENRYHQEAARRALNTLLPEPGSGIKGRMQSYEQLRAVSRYDNRETDFANLLQILDSQLRLITPTDPAGAFADGEPADHGRYYQLTHDYLINPLREWLTSKQKETRAGRAELRLTDRSAQWNRRPENRFLPSLWEDATIRLLTRRRDWTEPQRKMMRKSGVTHFLRAALAILVLATISWAGYQLAGSHQANSLVQQIATAQADDLPELIDRLKRHRQWADQRLEKLVESDDPTEVWRAQLALLPVDAQQVEPLLTQLLTAEPEEVEVLRQALEPHADEFEQELWEILERESEETQAAILPAASALALYAPNSRRWKPVAHRVTLALVNAAPLQAPAWAKIIKPASAMLLDPLSQIHINHDDKFTPGQSSRATDILCLYSAGRREWVCNLLLESDPEQFGKLIDVVRECGPPAVELLTEAFRKQLRYAWKDAPAEPSWAAASNADREAFESALGMLHERFAFCQEMPLLRFQELIESLRAAGYRPLHVRPFTRNSDVFVAGTWVRDAKNWHVAFGLSADGIQACDEQQRSKGLRVIDVAGYVQEVDGNPTNRYCAVWETLAPGDPETRATVGGTIYSYKKSIEKIDRQGFTESTAVQAFENQDGNQELCGIKGDAEYWFDESFDRSTHEHEATNLLSMTRIDVDVSSAPLQTIDERLQGALEEADADLTVNKNDLDALSARAKSLFWMNRYEEALAEMTRVILRSPTLAAKTEWVAFRARTHARLSNAKEANDDLESSREYGLNENEWMFTKTLVTALLGEQVAALEEYETYISEHASSHLHLHRAAQVYSLLSEIAAPQNPQQAAEFVERAIEYLDQAFASGLKDRLAILYEPEFTGIRDTERFMELMAPGILELRYAALWRTGSRYVSKESHGLAPRAHLVKCREFAAADYRPRTVSATYLPDTRKTVTASVWLQPRVTEKEGDIHARRQANAALALLQLCKQNEVWPVLKHSDDPSTRSYVIDRCSDAGVDPKVLIDRLRDEKDTTVQRALVLCLSRYDLTLKSTRELIDATLPPLFRKTDDPGLHAAIKHAYQHWGRDAELSGRADRVTWEQALEGRNWFHTSLGQRMVVIRGPKTFLMGSACTGAKQDILAARHHRTIPRSFAISDKEVTVEQFHKFLQDCTGHNHFYNRRYSPEKMCPQSGITWYDAVAFCRWLSDIEGIPDSEMCYPRVPEINSSSPVPLDGNRFNRSGYRLPTESEWEFACGAQASSVYPHGISTNLLDRYAWGSANADGRSWPGGQLLPNDFGLFDMLGNVEEWCDTPYSRHYFSTKPNSAIDLETRDYTVSRNYSWIARGGSWDSRAMYVGTSLRNYHQLGTRSGVVGFRIARTLPSTPDESEEAEQE